MKSFHWPYYLPTLQEHNVIVISSYILIADDCSVLSSFIAIILDAHSVQVSLVYDKL